jgi:hypothetical protein
MNELKNSLQNELVHVRTVWFDAHGNWFLHNVGSAVKSMTRDEILENEPERSEPEVGKKKRK